MRLSRICFKICRDLCKVHWMLWNDPHVVDKHANVLAIQTLFNVLEHRLAITEIGLNNLD